MWNGGIGTYYMVFVCDNTASFFFLSMRECYVFLRDTASFFLENATWFVYKQVQINLGTVFFHVHACRRTPLFEKPALEGRTREKILYANASPRRKLLSRRQRGTALHAALQSSNPPWFWWSKFFGANKVYIFLAFFTPARVPQPYVRTFPG